MTLICAMISPSSQRFLFIQRLSPLVPGIVSKTRISRPVQSRCLAGDTKSNTGKFGQKVIHNQTLRVYLSSPGTIIDSFVPRKRLSYPLLLSKDGWKECWQRLKALTKTKMSAIMIRRRLKGWNQKDFTKEAEQIYIQMNEALSQNNKNRLLELTTESYYRDLRQEWGRLNHGKNVQSVWKYAGKIAEPRILHIVVGRTPDKNLEFAQITVELNSHQSLYFQSSGHDRAGNHLENFIPVSDLLIYERNLVDPNGKWRVCAKLSSSG